MRVLVMYWVDVEAQIPPLEDPHSDSPPARSTRERASAKRELPRHICGVDLDRPKVPTHPLLIPPPFLSPFLARLLSHRRAEVARVGTDRARCEDARRPSVRLLYTYG